MNPESRIMKFFKTIYYIFIGLIAAIAVLLIVSALPITGNYKVMTVLSGSMEPTIKTGGILSLSGLTGKTRPRLRIGFTI
ncbi:hypothetical protein B5M47_03900 [candidate division CPR3 bacterium 4484_211]|uniref:Signal peptidase I n=1 Tax=candidate division CPR3 bacterium 4484_211 TaxID=1968527 RepID=A0A1W9NWE9_UNCC3|nr:MAG: hypothetical protein B5M47_03900 [candidate division CPR3 bacterium 4484_211]